MFNEAIMEGNMSTSVMGNIIINDVVYKNNSSFTIYWYSFLTGILNIATRVTQMYVRRVKTCKNYRYAKDLRPFETLSEEERFILFFPKFSLASPIEYL